MKIHTKYSNDEKDFPIYWMYFTKRYYFVRNQNNKNIFYFINYKFVYNHYKFISPHNREKLFYFISG